MHARIYFGIVFVDRDDDLFGVRGKAHFTPVTALRRRDMLMRYIYISKKVIGDDLWLAETCAHPTTHV